MTYQTKPNMQTEINTNLPDNTTGAITPSILRTTLGDMLDSWQQIGNVNSQVGTTYTVVVGDNGKLLTLNNAAAVGVALPQATTSFAAFAFAVSNLGAGTVTITPVTSTINGAATFALTTGQAVFIYSDGTNYQTIRAGATPPPALTSLTNSLGADVALNVSANYFDGPSVAQGTSGTWYVSGTVTLIDATTAPANIFAKLWDGTTVIASATTFIGTTNSTASVSLSGVITSPAGNLRISVREPGATTGVMKFNSTGNSKDSTVTAVRIQ
jgi:hypothetical protein